MNAQNYSEIIANFQLLLRATLARKLVSFWVIWKKSGLGSGRLWGFRNYFWKGLDITSVLTPEPPLPPPHITGDVDYFQIFKNGPRWLLHGPQVDQNVLSWFTWKLQNFQFMLSWRYWSHIQDFQKLIVRVSRIFGPRLSHFFKLSIPRSGNFKKEYLPKTICFCAVFEILWCIQNWK